MYDKKQLPRKVRLSGSDCFHLVLDKHAHRHTAGSNVMRIVLCLEQPIDANWLKDILNRSPLVHWLCNIRLQAGAFFSTPYWIYTDKGNTLGCTEHRHPVNNGLPELLLQRDIPLYGNRFIECDLVHYPGQKQAIVISWNHILLDGKGIGMLVQHLNEVYEGKLVHLQETFFPGKEKRKGLLSHIRNMYKVKRFIEASSKAPIASIASGQRRNTGSFNNHVIWFTAEETSKIAANATRHGARFGPNLFYLACCAHAVHTINQHRKKAGPLWVPIPYDGRLRGAFGPVITNTVAFLFYRLPLPSLTGIAQTVSSLLAQMTAQMKERMPQRYSQLLDMMRHIPLGLYYFLVSRSGEGSFSSFLYSATGDNFNNITQFLGRPVCDLTIYPSPTFPPGLTFSCLKHRDALNINIAYSPDIVDTFELDMIVQNLKRQLLAE